jgi:endoglucanase
LKRAKLYVDPHSQAMLQANEMRRSDPATAAILDRIAGQPQAMWMGEWNSDIFLAVKYFVGSAVAKKAVAVMIAYNMPHRDAAASEAGVGESEGGLATQEAYQRWIRNFAAGIGNSPAIVVMEPDALAGITSLPTGLSDERYFLFNDAIKVLRQNRNTAVYIDAGHATWVSPEEIAERLRRAGVEHASGFALNTANYRTTEECLKYGHKISELIDGKHFIIDTSRNGAGPYLEAKNETESWSNPFGRKLGAAPTTETGAPMVDGSSGQVSPMEGSGADLKQEIGGWSRRSTWRAETDNFDA